MIPIFQLRDAPPDRKVISMILIKWSMLRQEKLVGSQESFCYLVALNKKFLTLLASDLLLLIEQVLSQIGIILP
ncbi:hypothetical protein D9603_18135 [Pseudoalteromonas sp. PS5]|nr:hypothetical protein D9603_18135 [Pseudoalteromonas sp. PS5]